MTLQRRKPLLCSAANLCGLLRLRLRLSHHDAEHEWATFNTSDERVRLLFSSRAAALRVELSKRGVNS